MSIYVIGDLHLSFGQDKPMNIFGENWNDHANKIKNNWIKKVKEDDLVVLPGDFSWAMHLEDAFEDFKYLSKLPGTKLLLKGNHDYWWSTLNKMKNYLNENGFKKIDFIYNSAYLYNNKIIVGTRGWSLQDSENSNKMIHRENERLKLSIEDGIKQFGINKEIICFMHYPPINSKNIMKNNHLEFFSTMKQYNVKRCYYGHLHGKSHMEAINEIVEGIKFQLVSSDYLDFDLIKIED
ncbi:MAG TPA: metallophosphoesterase [Clostridiaceae bacterium]|nr:metallophosphoesterase [Clostridiaceae bacterium]